MSQPNVPPKASPSYAALDAYRNAGFKAVDGWCSEKMFEVVKYIDRIQIGLGLRSGVCEIGVHHGKFFILLNQIVAADAESFAVDVYDMQHLNIDRSGSGSLDKFKENLDRYDVHKGSNVKIVIADSTAAGVRERLPKGKLRIISIDGGHTAEHTVNDLQIALDVVCDGGVVFLDDIGNSNWLGVIEGLMYFLMQKPVLVPFAVGANKLLLTKLSFQRSYFAAFTSSPFSHKKVEFMGHKLVAIA